MTNASYPPGTPLDLIERRIHAIRGQRVMIERAVRRNSDRFPADFMFQPSDQEVADWRFQIGTSSSAHGGSRYLPLAFTRRWTN
jgi:ORF6N domain